MKADKCPVCYGKGIVANGFYSTTEQAWSSSSTTPETCRSCGGKGIVWYLGEQPVTEWTSTT